MTLADMESRSLMIAAPASGSGKTLFTLGLLKALQDKGRQVSPAKVGPDYIDGSFHTAAAGKPSLNLDPWAMSKSRLIQLAHAHCAGSDLLLIEAVMGLFDGAASGQGSSADLAVTLNTPVILIVDVAKQAQSVAALVHGFQTYRKDITIAGVVLNRVGSPRHASMVRQAVEALGLPVLGALPRLDNLEIPSRHLGLVQAHDHKHLNSVLQQAADWVTEHCDLAAIQNLAHVLPNGPVAQKIALPPLGQNIAVAHDAAFSFSYAHLLQDWRNQGANVQFFSPLADEAISAQADAVFLPGGYPELHAEQLAAAQNFRTSLKSAAARGALVYAECGGYMVLGETLTDKAGKTYQMTSLLPTHTRIDRPRRQLGYRTLRHQSRLPFPSVLRGHEFHYSTETRGDAPTLFEAQDALGTPLPAMGVALGNVMGSYAHIIDRDAQQ